MNVTVEIDPDSGFCGGVIRAVDRAEEYLSGAEHSRLYSLGSIVHNEAELSRLRAAGLVTIGLSDLSSLHKGDSFLSAPMANRLPHTPRQKNLALM